MSTQIEPFYLGFGPQVQAARRRLGLSQAQLGRRLNPALTRASIANIENAKQRVLGHTLVELAEILDLSLRDLRGRPQRSVGPDEVKIEAELSEKLGISLPDARKLVEKAR